MIWILASLFWNTVYMQSILTSVFCQRGLADINSSAISGIRAATWSQLLLFVSCAASSRPIISTASASDQQPPASAAAAAGTDDRHVASVVHWWLVCARRSRRCLNYVQSTATDEHRQFTFRLVVMTTPNQIQSSLNPGKSFYTSLCASDGH